MDTVKGCENSGVYPNEAIWPQLWAFIASGYVFKLVIALVDTLPFYIVVHYLSRYLEIDPNAERGAGEV